MTRFCDQCGAELKPKAMFCSKCGAKSDLEPKKSVINESTDKKVNKKVNYNNTEFNDNVGETGTIGRKTDNIINKTNENSAGGFDLNNIDWNTVLKYSVAGTIISLTLGIIFFSLYWYLPDVFILALLAPFSFIFAVILTVVILTAHIKDKTNAIVVGFIVGLLTGILQFTTISMIFRIPEIGLSIIFGNPVLVLIIVGVIFGYVGNVYLRDKINFPVINQYLGE